MYQHKDIQRTDLQNVILDLEQKYMDIIEEMITSSEFLNDLKGIESETREYYEELSDIWGKKNKVKEVSERLLRHHCYQKFSEARNFYASPISCDIAMVLDDAILNIDVKTIDKVGNSGELLTTQFEHNQTSFINNKVMSSGVFPGFSVKSNIKTIDPVTDKPVLTFLVKIAYYDDNNGSFGFINSNNYPSLTLTCLPNGTLSNLFENDLFSNFKDYVYFNESDGAYYKPKQISVSTEWRSLNHEQKFARIEQVTNIPDNWTRVYWVDKVGYYDTEINQIWWTLPRKRSGHHIITLEAVKYGNTARFNDLWLSKRFNSRDEEWEGIRKYHNIYGNNERRD